MRSVFIFILLNLCAINSGAQVKIIDHTNDCCQCMVGSQSVDSIKEKARLEKFFRLRTAQRMYQLESSLIFINQNNDSVKVAYYKGQVLKLFNIDAKVIMRRKRKIENIGVKTFIDEVANHKITLKSIDSIRVPIWNYELVKEAVSDSVFSKSEMCPFRQQQKFGNEKKTLAIIKENTEDGAEWMPLFGDMVVTVKKNKSKKRKWIR